MNIEDINNKYIQMHQVIGDLAFDYNIPLLRFEDLVELGKRTVTVYKLDKYATKIPFADLCEYISMFVKTPFGENLVKKLASNY